jgi:hypothetical protein
MENENLINNESNEKSTNSVENLKHKHFSNKPEDLFDEVKELEDRFIYTIKMTKEKYTKDVQAAQVKWAMEYQNAIKMKKNQLEKDIGMLSLSIDDEIEMFNAKEKSILKSINSIAEEEEDALIEDIISLMGFEF